MLPSSLSRSACFQNHVFSVFCFATAHSEAIKPLSLLHLPTNTDRRISSLHYIPCIVSGVSVIKIDADLFLGDFDTEARAHIEKIEASFLDAESLTSDTELMNSVFRAAHSLKGTAGFFSLEKIVTVAHGLESVFSQIKDGKLEINNEITDTVMQSVDCLRDLLDNIRADEAVDITNIIDTLKKYSDVDESPNQNRGNTKEVNNPFDCSDPDTETALKDAIRHGYKVYYVNINYNRGLGKYFNNPDRMFDNIWSIGVILEAIVNGKADEIIRERDPAALTGRIVTALSERDTSTLELLVTSVLEFNLFAIAIEINKRDIHPISREIVIDPDIKEKKENPEGIPEKRNNNSLLQTRPEKPQKQAPAQEKNFIIHLDISVINSLLDLANEMVLTRNHLLSVTSEHRKSIIGLTTILQDMSRLTSEIQERVMHTRMQPISVIFSKFPRIIRDTAKALNKDIEIEIIGGDVMLDKYLLDSLTDPITQLVKNSADHGVESAERRAELGKPEKGKITLNTYMRDGSAIIEVIDDGAGLDADALEQKARERGLLTEEALSNMQKSDIYALILEPGFSTAKHVTNISGRGIGMDIVKTNIENMGGSIEIETESGKGTTIRLRTPLTLSVMRVLIVVIDSIQYAVPEINIEQIVRISRSIPLRRLERVNDSFILVLNERIIPVVTIEEINAKARGQCPPEAAVLQEKSLRNDVIKFLILKTGDSSFALLIDDANYTEQTLVKPLPEFFMNCICYSSVTVLGNGDAITILDAEGILRLMGINGAPKEPSYDEDIKQNKPEEKQYIIFRSSGAEYFALEASEISRIETIEAQQIHKIGSGSFVDIAGKTIRVVRPESFTPVKNHRYTGNKRYLLTLRNNTAPVGILAGKVLDKVEASFIPDNERIHGDYIEGTGTFNGKMLICLNADAINEKIENDKQKRKTKMAGVEVWTG